MLTPSSSIKKLEKLNKIVHKMISNIKCPTDLGIDIFLIQ